MTDIPKRVFAIWSTPLNIDTCGGLLKQFKLQCSNCDEKFDTEHEFAVHIDICLDNAERDVNYLVHMHANRLLLFQEKVALFCGASQQGEYLECGLCKETFEDKQTIRRHIRNCARFSYQYGRFINGTKAVFGNMLFSYEQLGLLFKRYVLDQHIIDIRTNGSPKPADEDKPDWEVTRQLFFDELTEHFIEKYQDYLFEVCGLIDDAFIRYLKKKENDTSRDICYCLPPKRRKIEYEREEDNAKEEEEEDEEEVEDEEGDEMEDEEEYDVPPAKRRRVFEDENEQEDEEYGEEDYEEYEEDDNNEEEEKDLDEEIERESTTDTNQTHIDPNENENDFEKYEADENWFITNEEHDFCDFDEEQKNLRLGILQMEYVDFS